MAWGTASKMAGRTGLLGFSFLFRIYFYIVVFFFSLMLIHAVVLSFQSRDISPGFEFLAQKFISPTESLSESSQKIIENGLYIRECESQCNAFKRIYNTFLNHATLVFSLLIIVLYLRVLSHLITNYILWNTSMRPVGWVLAIIIFTGFQMVMLGRENWNVPVKCYWNVLRAIYSVSSPIVNKTSGNLTNMNLSKINDINFT